MKTLILKDEHERQRALDPQQSFIVQAPAGSGKTEILTQRYLVLLNTVKQPEEILAITFTKKSAAEMRARIIKALTRAANEPEPESAHDKKTWQIARTVLAKNAALHWNLLENPNRMQIQTIDSLNSSLTRQLPLLSHFGSALDISDDPNSIYEEAVEELLSHLEENVPWANAIETLLIHMDNNLDNVKKLVMSMLAKRDQWLPYIASNMDNPELRHTLEKNLEYVNFDTLQLLHDHFPQDIQQTIVPLLTFAADNLPGDSRSSLKYCSGIAQFPGKTLADKPAWQGIYDLLFTSEGTWRKTVNVKNGFPATDKTNKKLMLELLQQFQQNDGLKAAFEAFSYLPAASYDDSQWKTLVALHDVLRIAVAQLKVIFQQHGVIDYIENAQAALAALGSDECPTDLTLALDYRIQHILIDEFQDTSTSQYRLLEKLIAGWQPHDGRTLFLVGDPMQSIYRFREAEVGLFIRARQRGISALALEPLTLTTNFRSTPTIVNWVNEHFTHAFPKEENIGNGAVCFSASTAAKEPHETSCVNLHATDKEDASQIDNIVKLIAELRITQPEEKIAILVRTRSHLIKLLPALKNANLAFRALEIEKLAKRPIIQDLLSLTRALIFLHDRISWLAVLRAPWCGLTLADLWLIGHETDLIWEQLNRQDLIEKLSSDGQLRLTRILPHISVALAERRRYDLREWIEHTWMQLGASACYSASDLDDANAYFDLLTKMDEQSHLNFTQLYDAVDKLFASPNNNATDHLQIMTIHNAKGLEFDSVIIPHLESKRTRDSKTLLQWVERTRTDETSALILAPIDAVGEEAHSIYNYIRQQHQIKLDHEYVRLLYVAVTRAKKSLHLFFDVMFDKDKELKEPSSESLLYKLWPSIKAQVNYLPSQTIAENSEQQTRSSVIYRLTSQWKNPLSENKFASKLSIHQKKQGIELQDHTPRFIGTVIHRVLQMIAEQSADWWLQQSSENQQRYVEKQLLMLGARRDQIKLAIDIICRAVMTTLNDPRGQWILQPRKIMKTEYALTAVIDGKVKQLVIDRTFVDDQGVRWIVDYKSSFTENDVEGFLDEEQKEYQAQLAEYAEALRMLGDEQVRVGLYFPRMGMWREWESLVAEKM